jgi:transcriptional regulator with XRE-family HTH domain
MSDPIRHLIEQLIATARQQGMTQGELADKAGLTPVGLSNAKQRGDILASNLAELAAQLDLELTLIPHRRQEQAAKAIKSGVFFDTSNHRTNHKE